MNRDHLRHLLAFVLAGSIAAGAAATALTSTSRSAHPPGQRDTDLAGWSRFRGPNGSGVGDSDNLPVEIGPDRNVIWKTAVPEGYSSPVLTPDRIFLTAFENNRLLTIALDRATGRELWRREAPRPRVERLDPRNNPAAPSPTVDDARVYVFFAEFGLLAYDFDGNEVWRVPLGPFDNLYGMGASPVVFGGLVLLVCDQRTGSFLIAIDGESGDVVWKVDRPEAASSHVTPIVWQPEDGEPQLLVVGSFLFSGYSIATGERLWWVRGMIHEMKSVPVVADGVAYVNGYGSPLNDPGNTMDVLGFAADVDGDGVLDVVSGEAWYENVNGDGLTWVSHPLFTGSTTGVRVADLDRDGDLDVVAILGIGSDRVVWYENTNKIGTRWNSHVVAVGHGTPTGALAIADRDADGDLDLLVGFPGEARWFENTSGDASLWAPRVISWAGATSLAMSRSCGCRARNWPQAARRTPV